MTYRQAGGLVLPADVIEERQAKLFSRESLAQLAAEAVAGGWQRLTGQFEERDFDLMARSAIRELVYAFWMKNPLISRSVEIENNYVFGRGVQVSSDYEALSKLLQAFWYDPDNLVEMTGHMAQRQKNLDLKLFGNVYLALVTNPVTGQVKVRSYPDEEITDIVYDPEDRRKPLLYQRKWTPQKFDFSAGSYTPGDPQVEYIADWRVKPADLAKIGTPVRVIRQNVRIYHIKVNCVTESKFGNSEIYRAVDWAKAYNRFLEDWATVVAALSKFAFKQKVKGGPGAIGANATRWQTLAQSNDGQGPAAGSTLVEGQGVETTPMPKGGPSVTADDGRRLLLMVSAATGIMEHYYGDPSTGNLATATAMELPMQKQFESRQQLWWEVYTDVFDYQVEQSARATSGYLRKLGATLAIDEVTGKEVVILPKAKVKQKDGSEKEEPMPWEYDVSFPPIVQADVQVQSGALSQISTAGALPEREIVRLAARLMGIQDVDAVINEWEKEQVEKRAMAEEIAKGKGPQPPANPGDDPPTDDPLGDKAREAFIRTMEAIHAQLMEVAGRAA